MSRPFIDNNNQWYPEAIICFVALILLGCVGGVVIVLAAQAAMKGTLF
jgi:hypothetical protein